MGLATKYSNRQFMLRSWGSVLRMGGFQECDLLSQVMTCYLSWILLLV